MRLIQKIKSKLIYKEVTPLILNDQLRNAYQTTSIVGNSLQSQTAFVTGATSGIGLAIAERLLNEGCSVIISGRNKEKLEKTKKQLSQRCKLQSVSTIDTIQMDHYNYEQVNKTIKNLFENHPINIVINNAGVLSNKDSKRAFRSISKDEYYQTVDVNLKSTILIGELAASYMATNGGGNILNICSICGFSSNYFHTPYGISKTGIIAFTKKLSQQYANKGVVINGIAPGSVATIMNHYKTNDNISGFHPLNRIIMPEEIAALTAFMVGPIGKYLNGEIIKASATEEV